MEPKDTKGQKKPGRQPMPEQHPMERVKNFYEVPFGYSAEQAMEEAKRCIQCKKPLCVGGCPVNIDIPWFIRLVAEGKFAPAEANPFAQQVRALYDAGIVRATSVGYIPAGARMDGMSDKGNELLEFSFVPVPATFVVDAKGAVAFRHVDPDFRRRAEIDEVMTAVAEARAGCAS